MALSAGVPPRRRYFAGGWATVDRATCLEELTDSWCHLLAGADVTLTDEILDQIDEIVPPGTSVGTLDMAYRPPALQRPDLRRRPASDRSAA